MTAETPIINNQIPSQTPGDSSEALLAQIDLESEDVKTDKDELLKKTKQVFAKFDGENKPEIMWRVARDAYKAATVAEANGLKEKEKELLIEAEEYIKKALARNDKNPLYHAWAAYISGKLSNFAGKKERIARGHEMQHHLEEAIKLNDEDGGIWHSYGRWCLEVAKLSWVERNLAAALFAKPPEATYQNALDKFLEADKRKSDWRANYFWMAKCHIAMKNNKKTIEALDIAVKCTPKDEEDLTVEEELFALQKKYASYR